MAEKKFRFDVAIGNPPYQKVNENNNRQSPVYNYVMEAAYSMADIAVFITPARFLFDAGQTPKAWNKKMLEDSHLKVVRYEQDGSVIFPNTDIKGGVAITLRNENKEYGAIGLFASYPLLNDIVLKVFSISNDNLANHAYPKSNYGFSNKLYVDYPELKDRLTKGNEYIIDAGIFKKMPEIFDDVSEVIVHGRKDNSRVSMRIKKSYIKVVDGLNKYKVLITGANGTGKLGEVLSTPFVAGPNEVHTQTYMSIGEFDTLFEAQNCLKYIKTKFARCMLGVLKVTQNNPKDTWAKVPMQNFKDGSDISWEDTIHGIDCQLYKKYGLTNEERNFIETNCKNMP